ncbi:unnamed protein product [Owenia fusiformis]|uniref:Uncharacterized protein n=1 Tax=Owenia fusiformis TaxID=6347 RepID=A0A8J1UPU5_OWEFU|nr:unnamed protein product [Owenia fusiformis]
MEKQILTLIYLAVVFMNVNGNVNYAEKGELKKIQNDGFSEATPSNDNKCQQCNCTTWTVDCSNRNITSLPLDLPSNITTLDLSGNPIKVLPDYLLGRYYKNLKTLNITEVCLLKNLSAYVFHGLGKLQSLYHRCHHRSVPIKVNPYTFKPLKKIQNIEITGCTRTMYPTARYDWLEAFKGLQNSKIEKITYVYISWIPFIVKEINFKYFENCKLKELYMPNNKITAIETGVVKYLQYLEIIDFSRNMIAAFIPNDFVVPVLYLLSLIHLKVIKVDNSERRMAIDINNPRTVNCGILKWTLPLPLGLEELHISGTMVDSRPSSIPCEMKFQRENRLRILNAADTHVATYFGAPIKGLVNVQQIIDNMSN